MKTERIGFSTWTEDDSDLAGTLWGDPEVTKLCFAYVGDEYYEPTGLYHPSY